ncbi:hypothetical protein JCM10207_004432 [Rhodosporidiobolus poonsookiae]
MSTTTLLLLAIASTAELLTGTVPLLYAKQLYRAGRSLAFTAVFSTVALSLAGLLSLAALGTGGRGAAVVSGVVGALAVLLADLHVMFVAWRVLDAQDAKQKRLVKVALAATLSVLVLTATALHVTLLTLDSPAHALLAGLAEARAVVHLVFLAVTVLIFARQTKRTLDDEPNEKGRLQGSQIRSPHQRHSLDVWQTTTSVASVKESNSRWSRTLASGELRLVLLQALSILLDILSVALPIRPNYLLFDNRYIAPHLFGTTSSPASHLVLSVFICLRWTGLILDAAARAPAAGLAASNASLVPHYYRTPTPSPPTDRRAFSPQEDLEAGPASSPIWIQGSPSASSPRDYYARQASPEPPRFDHGKRPKGPRRPSLASVLSLGCTQPSTVDHSTIDGVDVQTVEFEQPYLGTYTAPLFPSYGDNADEEDLTLPSPADIADSPLSEHRNFRSLPPLSSSRPFTPPPPSPPSSANSSPTTRRSGSTSGLSFTPLLLSRLRRPETRSGTVTPASSAFAARFTPSPFPLESPTSSPRRKRVPSLSAPSSPRKSLDTTLRQIDEHGRLDGGAHGSTTSDATAYYSLPRSPPPIAQSLQSSPKKARRPSLIALGALTSSSTGTGGGTGTGTGGDSPTQTRSRSGSVGSLLRTLKRESTAPSLTTAESGARPGTPWEVEPNEEGDDPFAPPPPPPAETPTGPTPRRSVEMERVVEALKEVSEEGTADEAIEEEQEAAETGSIIDHGEPEASEDYDDEVERIKTPVPPRENGDEDDSPATTITTRGSRSRSGSESSVFIEHLDDDERPLSAAFPRPAALIHSASAGALGSAFRLDGPVAHVSSPPQLVHSHSYDALSLTKREGGSAYASAGERFRSGMSAAGHDVGLAPPTVPAFAASALLPLSTRATATVKRPSLVERPSLLGPSAPASPPKVPQSVRIRPSSPPLRTEIAPTPSRITTTLRSLRRKAASLPFDTGARTSTASDLSFACRGAVWTPSEPNSPQSAMEALPSFAMRLESPEEAIEKVEVAPASTAEETAQPVTQAMLAAAPVSEPRGGGRKAWWRSLPGSRPSTPYLPHSTPSPSTSSHTSSGQRLLRSQSVASSPFSSFLRTASSSASSDNASASATHGHNRHSSLQLPLSLSRTTSGQRLSAYQLPSPESVSPFGSVIFGPRQSSSSELRRSFVSMAPPPPLPSPPRVYPAQGIEEEDLAALDDLVLAFSPPTSPGTHEPGEPEWPSYPMRSMLDVGKRASAVGRSFEFSERSFSASSGRTSEEDQHPRPIGRARSVSAPLSSSAHSAAPLVEPATSISSCEDSAAQDAAATSPLSPALSAATSSLQSPLTPASFGFVEHGDVEGKKPRRGSLP